MPQQPKKTEIVRARVPYDDFEKWREICDSQDTSSSQALRQAMSEYIDRQEKSKNQVLGKA